jgi:ribosomal protein L37AE/L43A
VAGVLRTEYGWLPPPGEMFLKLGQPAQLIVVRDGILQRAVDNYGRGEGLKREREEAERRETKRVAEERRKVDEAVRHMRELDKSQCVFCGKKLVSHLSYVRITGGVYEVLERRYGAPDSTKFNADDVVLSCKSCASKLAGGAPEGEVMAPAFGRFSADGETTAT